MREVSFFRRIGVDVKVGVDGFDGRQNVVVGVMILVGMDAALDAHFRRAALDGVLALQQNFFVAAIEGLVLVILVAANPQKEQPT